MQQRSRQFKGSFKREGTKRRRIIKNPRGTVMFLLIVGHRPGKRHRRILSRLRKQFAIASDRTNSPAGKYPPATGTKRNFNRVQNKLSIKRYAFPLLESIATEPGKLLSGVDRAKNRVFSLIKNRDIARRCKFRTGGGNLRS